MDSRIDRFLKPLWLVDGILLLVALAAACVLIVTETISEHGSKDSVAAEQTTGSADVEARAVRFTLPDPIRGSQTEIALVSYGKSFGPRLMVARRRQYDLSSGSGESDESGATVNVLLIPPSGAGHLVFDRPAYVEEVRYPRDKDDSLRHWIEYDVAMDDANGDGKLDRDDEPTLWVSELDGARLTRVLAPSLRYGSAEPEPDGRSLRITAFERAVAGKAVPAEQQPQRAFVYDVPTRTLRPDTAIDSLIDRAARIVGRAVR